MRLNTKQILHRCQILALKQTKTSISEIARIIGCYKSTISRELKRNQSLRDNLPKQAYRLANKRRVVNKSTITDFDWSYIEYLLNLKYSPEKITGRLRYLGWTDVPCHEIIYQCVMLISNQVVIYINIFVIKKPILSEI